MSLLHVMASPFPGLPLAHQDLTPFGSRPSGEIAAIDVPPKKSWPRVSGAVDRGGHGIEPTELQAEMRGAGFEVVAHHEEWPAEDDATASCSTVQRSGVRS
jgi:hypothetical protein